MKGNQTVLIYERTTKPMGQSLGRARLVPQPAGLGIPSCGLFASAGINGTEWLLGRGDRAG